MSRPTLAEVAVGDALPAVTFPITREHLVRYCGASGDFNTIHWNERIAREVDLPDVIAHGMLTMATAVRVVTAWCGDPGAVVQYGVRFTKAVPVSDVGGTELTVGGVVAVKDEDAGTVRVDLTATIPGPDGGTLTVLGRARAVVRLPATAP
ncbi:MAG TPA: MaoC/PaaZ C-terminal domain-containing protein [Actinomycetales bacterium]